MRRPLRCHTVSTLRTEHISHESYMKASSLVRLLITLIVLPSLSATAATSASVDQTPDAEEREAMAKMHEQMAGCLRSGRAVMECRMEMMKTCDNKQLDKHACSMDMHEMAPHHMSSSSASHEK